ncbi:iron chaperone [Pseudarthrobacter sp. DSP2-3-2b1]|uniref:iron chaperone n=1 Tax=Pseudarthrobacter sp. DSP2-3-2b1 TaxID=2804661 RepID=UPI003CEBD87E
MTASSITEYIDQFDGDVRDRLLTVYEMVRSAVPAEAEESISWRMPAFKLGTEPLFFFTGTKRHIGFYPTPDAIAHFSAELAAYGTTDHIVQLPHSAPLPTELIREMITWRLQQLPSDKA